MNLDKTNFRYTIITTFNFIYFNENYCPCYFKPHYILCVFRK